MIEFLNGININNLNQGKNLLLKVTDKISKEISYPFICIRKNLILESPHPKSQGT